MTSNNNDRFRVRIDSTVVLEIEDAEALIETAKRSNRDGRYPVADEINTVSDALSELVAQPPRLPGVSVVEVSEYAVEIVPIKGQPEAQ